MRRSVSRASQGENIVRVVAKMEGNPCVPESQEAFKELVEMLRTINDMPDLLRTETMCPESVRFYHNGENWVVESVSTVIRPMTDEYP